MLCTPRCIRLSRLRTSDVGVVPGALIKILRSGIRELPDTVGNQRFLGEELTVDDFRLPIITDIFWIDVGFETWANMALPC